MEKALKAVLLLKRQQIPKSTLGARVCGKVLLGSGSGPKRILNDKKRRSRFNLSAILPTLITPSQGRILWQLLKTSEKARVTSANLPMDGGIVSASSTLILPSVSLSQVRAKATDGEVMDNYFGLLEKTLDERQAWSNFQCG